MKNWWSGLSKKMRFGIVLVVLVAGSLMFGEEEQPAPVADAKQEAAKEVTLVKDSEERKVMNGAGNEQIGTYVHVKSSRKLVTEENLLTFVEKELPKYEGQNWVLIDLGDGYGVSFAGAMPIGTYVLIDEDGKSKQSYETLTFDLDKRQVNAVPSESAPEKKSLFN